MNETPYAEPVPTVDAVAAIVSSTLGIGDHASAFDATTPLFGSLAELDSMAVVELVTELEGRFGIVFDDDDVTGEAFATVGSLAALVDRRRG